ncbi:MAG: type II secretion system protein M [Burkholderiaceae bacterium]|nr:type II secretion system protein M [Burkholderiaceae bacterium]
MNLESLRRFWSEREPRERTVLAFAAALVIAALLYSTLIGPALSDITRMKRALPNSRTQAAQLQALLSEVRTLKSHPAVAATAEGEAPAEVQKSLASAGLKASRMVPLANGALQLTFTNVSYASWSVWLATAERELGMRAAAVTVKATATPGNADVELALKAGGE